MVKYQRSSLLAYKTSNYSACCSMTGEKSIVEKEFRPNECTISVGEENFHAFAYRRTFRTKIINILLTIFTIGTYQLIAYWIPKLKVYVSFEQCPHNLAEVVMIIDHHNIVTLKEVDSDHFEYGVHQPNSDGTYNTIYDLKSFFYRKMRYVWYDSLFQWKTPSEIDSNMLFSAFLCRTNDEEGLILDTTQKRVKMYGRNSITVSVPSIASVLFREVLSPFYIFQLLSVILWYSDNYPYYASVIVVISLGTIIYEVKNIRSQYRRIKQMVGGVGSIDVIRESETLKLGADQLVPGDIICIPSRVSILPCDALLLNGSVIVNESMLTGESVPVTKVPVDGADDKGASVRFSNEMHSRHLLFCGTTVLQSRYYRGKPVRAVVVRTAFSTLKGQLVRAILYPKPADPQYMKDILMFVMFLFCVALFGFGFTVFIMVLRGEPFMHILVRSLDLITIVVPPALPAAMSVGTLNARMRLIKKNIFCISPSTINICGLINVVCFDKTGTLTEDGLDFHKFRAIKRFGKNVNTFTKEYDDFDAKTLIEDEAGDEIIIAAATCQSLTRIDGEIHGDPLDLILFNKSKWTLEEPVHSDKEEEMFDMFEPTLLKPPESETNKSVGDISVVRQFTFSSALQRMSVIVSKPPDGSSDSMTVFCKGSPEMIASLCDPSTIPTDYMNVVNFYAHKGYRIIALASRNLGMSFSRAMRLPRAKVECDLQLLGIVVMENRLKSKTTGVIRELTESKTRSVMVTGDNLLTAISVGRECEIIRPNSRVFLVQHSKNGPDAKPDLHFSESVADQSSATTNGIDQLAAFIDDDVQLAMTGDTFGVVCSFYPELVELLISKTDVFARMSPDQKSGLVAELQKKGNKVMMCGDGANDCQALKTADAGISLSDAEASIAAPFTSKVADIRCVPEVMKEGRCALVTSFAVFKYMASYSLTEFITVLLLYVNKTNMTDSQFLYIDFVLITIVALALGNTAASEKLSARMPPSRLMSYSSVASVLGMLLIGVSSQVFIFFNVEAQSWYVPYVESEYVPSMKGTALFSVTSLFYLSLAVVYSPGAPYRKPIYTNWLLCSTILIIGLITLVITIPSIQFLDNFMGFIELPSFKYRLFVFGVSVLTSIVLDLYERFFVQGFVLHRECVLCLPTQQNKIRATSILQQPESGEGKYVRKISDLPIITKL